MTWPRVLPWCPLGVLTLALLLSGCLRSEQTLVVRGDGTGTLVQETTIDLAKARAAIQIQQRLLAATLPPGALEGEEEDPFLEFDPAHIRQNLEGAEGVTLEEATLKSSEDGAHLVQRVHYTFRTLRHLVLAGGLGEMDVTLEALDDGVWRLVRRLAYEGSEPGSTRQRDEARRRLREASLKPYEAILKDLSISSSIQLPGTVLRVNEDEVPQEAAQRPVTWRIGAPDLLDDARLRHVIQFKPPAALKLEAFAVTVEDIANAREERALAREEAEREKKDD